MTLECNGEAAIEAVARDSTIFDVVIMDFAKRVMGGLETTRQLRSAGFERPIIAITGQGAEIPEESWLSAGVNAFLRRPFGFVNLVATVQRLTRTLATESETQRHTADPVA